MSKKIMVVDDSRIAQLQLEKVLPEGEYEVVACCQTGEEALDQYDKVNPDLVTMDIILPGMDGLEAARALLATHPEARILMVSSLAYDDTIKEAEALGAKGFVFKPFDQDQLLQAMQKAFAEA
ncbi:MAG TPA: response regulator [Candidatus Fournierella merdavium]|nr:response regulator [Candidatus Fournierella merdavium]